MSNLVQSNFTSEQLSLIKNTIAKNATDDELSLFLYRCKHLGLDPLKPGMIHFVKYGNSPGTIVVGIEGFRSKAASTGKHSGTKRGVLRDDKGVCVGAWCEVYRSDWTQPAREEVSLHEYNTNKGPWQKMPETMIKKVAEAAALRMAFPDDLGGVYTNEEMDQAQPVKPLEERTVLDAVLAPPERPTGPLEAPKTAGDHVVRVGKKYVGMKISEIATHELEGFVSWVNTKADAKFRESDEAQEFLFYAENYLAEAKSNDLDKALAKKLEE